jgi:hypothetical protein
MKIKEKFAAAKSKVWSAIFHFLHRRWLTIYEKHIKPNSPSLPKDYVSTSIVTEPISGKLLQVDVFSTSTAQSLAQERLQAAFAARVAAMKRLGLDEFGNELPKGLEVRVK